MLIHFIYLLVWPLFWLAYKLAAFYLLLLATTGALRWYKLYSRCSKLLPVSRSEAIFITGATSGIGLAVAKHLYKCGYSVIAGYYDEKESGFAELKALSKANSQSGNKMLLVRINVRNLEDIERAYAETKELLGQHKLKLFGLINNAGLGSFSPFAMCNKRELVAILETNLLGTMLTTRVFLPQLVRARGRILNVASALGLAPGATYLNYGVTKAGQLFFTRALNKELCKSYGEHEVKSVTILPHNFIKHTNIARNFLEKHEHLWEAELSEEERELYRRDFERHRQRLKGFAEASEQFRALKLRRQQEPSKGDTIQEQLVALKDLLACKNTASGLDDPNVLEAFELALRLAHPPEEIAAGDKCYNLFTSALILSLPSAGLSLFGDLINETLYQRQR